MKNLINAGIGAVILIVPLDIWRVTYPICDWAVLALVPLAAALFLGHVPPGIAMYRARMGAALRIESPFTRILTGQIGATLSARAFSDHSGS